MDTKRKLDLLNMDCVYSKNNTYPTDISLALFGSCHSSFKSIISIFSNLMYIHIQ